LFVQAKSVNTTAINERDILHSELHVLGIAFRAKHDKLQEQVGSSVRVLMTNRNISHCIPGRPPAGPAGLGPCTSDSHTNKWLRRFEDLRYHCTSSASVLAGTGWLAHSSVTAH